MAILHKLGVQVVHPKAPKVIPIDWILPPFDWIKVHTNGAVSSCLDRAGYGGIFYTYRGFYKGGFGILMGMAFAFEAELLVVIHAMDYAMQYQWDNI